MGLMTKECGFDSWQEEELMIFSAVSGDTVGGVVKLITYLDPELEVKNA
jgi:hypothetical protein